MTAGRTGDLWWKNAVVYCLDVETFLDWNGDGCGDLEGLTERVDYLASGRAPAAARRAAIASS